MENWKDIVYDGVNYTNLYQVSDYGRVMSLKTNRILKGRKDTSGYFMVVLCKDGKQKNILIHRLVAETFLPNPFNLPCVNHKDEDKTNNFVGTPENDYKDGNLEWCTHKYNTNYGTCIERRSKKAINGKCSKPVLQYSLDGTLISEWSSVAEIQRKLGYSQGNVSSCCRGLYNNRMYGFIWKYKEVV